MNQQRSRRFRAAQEAADKEEERRESIKLFEAMGHPVSEEAMNKKSWDTNAITPGTPFMDLLSKSLKYWISWKLTNDPGWKDVKVILSDSSVPGEGEHKIVDWIRRQRTDPGWDANTSHVIYGLVSRLKILPGRQADSIGCRSDHAGFGNARTELQSPSRRCLCSGIYRSESLQEMWCRRPRSSQL
jgi:5'-3' exoribonuclease 2